MDEQNPHSIEKASKFSLGALERMQKEGLMPTPENYELWYVYHSGSNPDVTRAIDILEASGQKITDEQCQELYHQFLGENVETEQVRKAGNQIKETIKDVNKIVSDVQDTTSKYNAELSEVTGQLSSDLDKDQLEGILNEVKESTQGIIANNQTLEEQLAKSSNAMEQMQRDLEIIRREALTDSLTGLANRKAFDAEIVRVATESQEEGQSFALIMMDIDHFKSFNDNFGHQVGDQVLRLVAKTLTDGVKGKDIAARYGGEEFAIILPDTNLQAGMIVGDALRRAVANKDVVNRNTGDKLGRITLSGGVAQYMAGENIEDLIARADAALYSAKNAGRNQIAAAPLAGEQKVAG